MSVDSRFYELANYLWQGSKYAYYWFPNDGTNQKYTYWFAVDPLNVPEIPKYLLNTDCYFSVNGSNMRKSQHERADNANIVIANALYTEFDCKTEADKKAAYAKIATWKHQPACVNDSGGGLHCYLFLHESQVLDAPEKHKRFSDLQWAFAQFAGGDTGVNDLARVLRVPGTVNHKAHFAPNFPTVKIVEWEPSRVHDITDIAPLLQPFIEARAVRQAHTPSQPSAAVSLSDRELLEVLFRSRNGHIYQDLWGGKVNGDHSQADQILCNGLAWVTGRDISAMDRLFRQSGLMREKWEKRDDYRKKTLNNAASSAQQVYTPSQVDQEAVKAAEAAVGLNGSQSRANGAGQAQGQQTTNRTYKIPNDPKTNDYIDALEFEGFYFRLNDLNDRIEVNGKQIDEVISKTIKNRMRDLGFRNSQLVPIEDAYWEESGKHRYHPIKDYLQGLRWDGDDHIRLLARHFKDKHDPLVYEDGRTETVFYAWLKRWLVAAVAKTFGGNVLNAQNAVLVLEGGQNLGKSTFARWLCSGVPDYFLEKSVEPDNKEDERRLASTWIWEIGELGATTRKADREALKQFLTREKVTWRNPYAETDSNKPALASFVGTVNNEGGFLQDATGTRRFMTVGLVSIQHSYVQDIDIDQVWAQAYQLYAGDEPFRPLREEAAKREEINADYKIEDIYEGWVLRYFDIDPARGSAQTPGWFTPTQEIISELKKQGVTDNTTAISMRLPSTMKGMGLEKTKQFKRTGPMGYWGIKIKP